MEKPDLNSTFWRCGADWRDHCRPIPDNARYLYNNHSHHSRAFVVDGACGLRLRCPDCGAEFPHRRG